VKVALYARVSLDESKEDRRYQEPDNQLQPLREWASAQGWDITADYVDRCSGADHNRPEFQRLLSDGMQRKFNAVLVWKLDRFSREGIGHTLSYIQRLRDRGVAVKSMTEAWVDTSLDNPLGEFLIAVFSWVAAEERRKISQRTKAGIARRRAIGQWRGGRPKGKRDAPLTAEGVLGGS
jgi:DNA invertase Pin-like site-specific DNA recombinase